MVTVGQIASALSPDSTFVPLVPNAADQLIERGAPVATAGPAEVAFASAKRAKGLAAEARAGLLILDQGLAVEHAALAENGVRALVITPNPRLEFLRIVERFFAPPVPRAVHESAVVDASARLGPGVGIGALSTVGADVSIGENTVVHAGVHIYPGVRIGRGVVIHSGCVIGSDGFGFERTESGEVQKAPHVGSVRIEDDVELQAACHVSRGMLVDTVIGQGTKLDSGCHVAHNVVIGKHCLIAAHAMIAGSVTVGDRVWIGPSAAIVDHVSIGDGAEIVMCAFVTKDVPAGERVLGAPARPTAEHRRLSRALARLMKQE